MDRLTREQINKYIQIFKLFDREEKGQLNAKELSGVLSHLGQNDSENQVNRIISEFDADGKGGLNFTEFVKLMANEIMKATPGRFQTKFTEEELKADFDARDTDEDGFINVAELDQVIRNLGHMLTYEELNKMVRDADAGVGDNVSFEGFKKVILGIGDFGARPGGAPGETSGTAGGGQIPEGGQRGYVMLEDGRMGYIVLNGDLVIARGEMGYVFLENGRNGYAVFPRSSQVGSQMVNVPPQHQPGPDDGSGQQGGLNGRRGTAGGDQIPEGGERGYAIIKTGLMGEVFPNNGSVIASGEIGYVFLEDGQTGYGVFLESSQMGNQAVNVPPQYQLGPDDGANLGGAGQQGGIDGQG